jgi:hypothetical protein
MTNYVKCPDCGNEAPQQDVYKYGRCVFCYEERSALVDKEFEEPIDDVDGAYPCECGCGCSAPFTGPCSSYCKRCAAGDCPHPDEKVPAECPHCGGKSNRAVIDEFGWCLNTSCTHPRNNAAYRLALVRGY